MAKFTRLTQLPHKLKTKEIMRTYSFCPECNIGLNSREMELCFCQNCKADWADIDLDDESAEIGRLQNT